MYVYIYIYIYTHVRTIRATSRNNSIETKLLDPEGRLPIDCTYPFSVLLNLGVIYLFSRPHARVGNICTLGLHHKISVSSDPDPGKS